MKINVSTTCQSSEVEGYNRDKSCGEIIECDGPVESSLTRTEDICFTVHCDIPNGWYICH
jgi:hypothetical protein